MDKRTAKDKMLTLADAMSMSRQEVRDYYRRYINPGLASMMALIDFDKRFVKAEGLKVYDHEGQEYLDFLGGYGSLNLGHNPPAVLEAIQLAWEAPNILQASLNSLAAAFAHNLALVTPGDLSRVFFCNSGAEAVEGALKLARAYHRDRPKILYCANSFHGKTFGALSVTGRNKYRAPFEPLLAGCEEVPFGDLDALEERLAKKDVAAFITEPIQGEGGVNVPPEGYLAGVREICDKYHTLFILDEIQTGLGRTGRLFACEHEDIVPDIICLSKSLGGGVIPVGAYITKPEIWDAVYGGLDKYAVHTSTFGGNTLAMAAGITALEYIIKQNLPAQAADKGRYLLEKLKALPDRHGLLKEVRGKGLLIGLEFNQPVTGFWDKLTAGKVNRLAGEYLGSLVAGELMNKYRIITAYTLNNPNVIRLEPPLTVSKEAMDKVISSLQEILGHGFTGVMAGSVSKVAQAVLKRKVK